MVLQEFNSFRNFFKTLNDGSLDGMCLGFVLGMLLGLIPFSINSFFIVLISFVLKTEKATEVLALAIFSLIRNITDPLAHLIGYFVLVKVSFLKPIWSTFYNMPLVPFTHFNNTLVMGNTILGLVLVVPMYIIVKKLILKYRDNVHIKQFTHKIFENKYLLNIKKIFEHVNKVKNIANLAGK